MSKPHSHVAFSTAFLQKVCAILFAGTQRENARLIELQAIMKTEL